MKKEFWFGLLLLIASYQIWPVLSNPNSAFAWGGDDGIITWQLNQTISKIPGHLDRIFQGNIFYPYKNTAAYHMLLIPSAFLSYLPAVISGNPITAYNTALIIGQILTLAVLYFWLVDLTKDPLAAFLGAVTFAFCQIRLFFDVHIHFWIMQWMLISTWMIWRYTKNQQVWQIYAAGLFFGIQVWESVYQAFWIIIFAFVLLVNHIDLIKKDSKHFLINILLIILITSPVLLVYLSIFREFGNTGSLRESANFSMSLNDVWGKFLSPGLYVNFLISLICLIKLRSQKIQIPAWLWVISAAGIILALGPVLKWHDDTVKILGKIFLPLPFGVLYYLIPGLSYLRSVHRYIWLFGLGLSIITAVVYSDLKGKNRNIVGLLFFIIAILGGSTVQRSGVFPAPANYPAVYSWLAKEPGSVILEYPVYTWADGQKHGLEMYRMVYSLRHKKALIGGASGFLPPQRGLFLSEIISSYPSQALDQKLRQLGVNYLVYHKNEQDENQVAAFKLRMNLPLVWEDPETAVYSLL